MASDAIREVSFDELARRLDARGRRLPLDGTLETTFRCNLACVHCYVNQPAGKAAIREQELSLGRLRSLIDEIVEAGCLSLLLTGGEVLVRPDFPDLYVHALRRGLLVTVFTNGTLITEEIADLFDRHRPERVEITLYGMTREVYERVTRVSGSFDKCLAGIRRLAARGVRLGLKTMALRWNQHEIAAMRDFAKGLGLDFRFDGLLNARVDCGASRHGEMQLSAEQLVALDLGDARRSDGLKSFCDRFVPRPEDVGESERVFVCGAGQSSFTVDPYGRLQMCQLARRAFFDLRRGSFKDGWDGLFPRLRSRAWQTHSACRRCNLISLCGSCPGAAETETGDLEGKVAKFCEVAHLQAFTFMGEASGHRPDASCCLAQDPRPARSSE